MYLFELVCKEAGLTEDDWNGEDFITVEGMTKLRDLFISKGDLEL